MTKTRRVKTEVVKAEPCQVCGETPSGEYSIRLYDENRDRILHEAEFRLCSVCLAELQDNIDVMSDPG